MTTSGKVAIVPGIVCALLAGVVLGGCSREMSEQEKYYKKLNEQQESEERQSNSRIQAMNAAKAVVIAAITAADSNGYVVPGPNGFKDFVRPKLAAEDVKALDSFVWTFPGGNLNDIESIATTEIGHVPFPEGRAVAYADGSVKIPEE